MDKLIVEEYNYLHIIRYILIAVGEWPTQQTRTKQILRSIIQLIMLSAVFTQSSLIILHNLDLDVTYETLPILLIALGLIICPHLLHQNDKTNMKLLLRFYEFLSIEREGKELEIVQKYARISKRICLYIIFYVGSGLFVFILIMFCSQILDVLIPLNESRPVILPVKGGFFLDNEENSGIIIFHTILCVVPALLMLGGLLCMLVTYIYHSCSRFVIIGYRLQKIFTVHDEHRDEELKRIHANSYRDITYCIKLHEEAIEYVNLMNTLYAGCLCSALLGSLILITVQMTDMDDLSIQNFKNISLGIGQLGFFAVAAAVGQHLIDVSGTVARKAYSSYWYKSVPSVQKLLILVIKKSQTPSALSAYGIYVISLETFNIYLQIYMSYFMVLREAR